MTVTCRVQWYSVVNEHLITMPCTNPAITTSVRRGGVPVEVALQEFRLGDIKITGPLCERCKEKLAKSNGF